MAESLAVAAVEVVALDERVHLVDPDLVEVVRVVLDGVE